MQKEMNYQSKKQQTMEKMKIIFLTKMTIVSLLLSCNADDTSQTENQPIGSVPSELVGTWLESWSLTMNYEFDPLLYNPTYQEWFSGALDPWSMSPVPGFGIEIKANGNFVWTQVVSISNGGCQVYTAEYLKGVVGGSLNQLTFQPQVRRLKYHSVCNPNSNSDWDDNTNAFTATIQRSTETNYSGQQIEQLKITDTHGVSLSYYRLVQ